MGKIKKKTSLNKNNTYPPWTADSGKMLHILAVSMRTFQALLLILENSPFSCIPSIFLDKSSFGS